MVTKNHLDAGFTDQVDVVVELYLKRHLVREIAMNNRMSELGPERLSWTAGSRVLNEALRQGNKNERAAVERGIALGALSWHALSLTTHTDFLTEDFVRAAPAISH